MTDSPHASALLGPLVSDGEASALFSDRAAVRALLDFEAALAGAEGRAGVIPAVAAEGIAAAAAKLRPDWDRLGEGSAASGHPVAALVAQLRDAAGPHAGFVHLGATAQDAVDTALVLRLAPLLRRFDRQLGDLVRRLATAAADHRRTVMAGRTRHQQAVPITLGLKLAGWLLPLARHRQRLAEMAPRVLVVQLGGAAGTLSGLGSKGVRVLEELGRGLGLGVPPMPWHVQRDGFAELAGWLSMVSGALGKIGTDLALLSQSEVAEASDGSVGSSSVMPQKSNPVRAETLVTLARANAGLLATMHHALVHDHERGGSAWSLEWLTLPQMASQTAAGLRLAGEAVSEMRFDAGRMRDNIDGCGRGLLAEAAAAALSEAMPRREAVALVRRASLEARAARVDLIDALRALTGVSVDWDSLEDAATWLGSSDEFVDRALAFARP